MASTLTANFNTRRDADLTIERLVQEFGVERTDIFVTTEGNENSAGVEAGGSDSKAASPSPAERTDAALTGRITLSVDVQDDADVAALRAAFDELGGEQA